VEADDLVDTALLTHVITAGEAAQTADEVDGWAKDAYELLYANPADEYPACVLDYLEVVLSDAGWVVLNRSTWEGGLEEALLRRGEHCLAATYDPVTHQLRLLDGKPELDATLQLLADDGVLTGDEAKRPLTATTPPHRHGASTSWPLLRTCCAGACRIAAERPCPGHPAGAAPAR